MRLILIGNPTARRTALFKNAVTSCFPALPFHVVPWADVICETADLRRLVREGDLVRLDSPGRDFEVERLLLHAGAEDGVGPVGPVGITPRQIDQLAEDRGRILWPAQWYRGFCSVLERLGRQLRQCPPHQRMSDPGDIQVMFDKPRCHDRMMRAGVPVPQSLGPAGSFDELVSRMDERGCNRVFVKLAYGSSASGAIALRTDGRHIQGFTTVELDGTDADGRPKLYNTRRIRHLRTAAEVAAVANEVCRHGAQVERWMPKAGIDARVFDLRVVVIAGTACHTVVRLSHTPFTNLHLLNERAEAGRVRSRCGEAAWAQMMSCCQRAAGAFPDSLHAGVDLLVTPDFRRHAVLEVNAFGDLLPGATWNGMDTYEAELRGVFGAHAMTEVA